MLDDKLLVPQTQDEFLAKYADTHTEFTALETLSNNHRIKNSACDSKMVRDRGKLQPEGKRAIEADCWKEREEKTRNLFFDLLAVRQKELLSKEDFPITHLVSTIVKLMPQKVESKNETVHSFADMVKKVKAEFERTDVIDAEGNPI